MRNLKQPGAFWDKGLVFLVLISLGLPAIAAGEEEFTGPFPSWRDARRDYGARGDGMVDDSPALQRALDELVKHTTFCVLYLPAGTYRQTYYGTLTLQEFTTSGGILFSPGSLTVKDNILIAGNLKEDVFDIDAKLGYVWDSRAYRFIGSGQIATITGNYFGDIDSNFLLSGSTVPEEADIVQDEDSYWTGAFRYNLSHELGGEGPNIKYRFKIRKILIDDSYDVNAYHTGFEDYASSLVRNQYLG